MPTNKTCSLVDNGTNIKCNGTAMITSNYDPLPISPPVTFVVPPSGLPGRTTFTVTYTNLAEPAVDAARYAQLLTYTNSILGSFATTLGSSRDQSLASNAINVNVDLKFQSISEAYLLHIRYGGSPFPGDPLYYPGICWRITMTKYYSVGVQVLEIPLQSYTDPNQWPSDFMSFPLYVLYDTTTRVVSVTNTTLGFAYNTPQSWFTCSTSFTNCQFYWTYTLPLGSTAVPVNLKFSVDSVDLLFQSPVPVPASNYSPFIATPTTIIPGTASGNIGLSILAQAGPENFYYQLGTQSQTALWDSTGETLPLPTTPFNSITASSGPLVSASQWRFMRVLPDWLAAVALRATFDSALPSSLNDIHVSVNSDSNRLQTGYYDFSDSFLTSSPALYCFKTVLCHEMMHGLGFAENVSTNAGGGTVSISLYNHYAFNTAQKPANPAQFQINNRSNGIGNVNWISNGNAINAPIEPTSTSHLLLSAFSANGIMEPIIYPGSTIPTGTAPNGGPSANDYGVLLCLSIFSLQASVCVHKDTRILTMQGEKTIREVCHGDMVQDATGSWIEVVHCLEVPANGEFIFFPKGVLGDECPSSDFRIRSGHPLLVNGREVNCEQLVGFSRPGFGTVQIENQVKSQTRVYSLVTKERSFVRMQNLLVGTWSQAAWENYRTNDCNSQMCAFEH